MWMTKKQWGIQHYSDFNSKCHKFMNSLMQLSFVKQQDHIHEISVLYVIVELKILIFL